MDEWGANAIFKSFHNQIRDADSFAIPKFLFKQIWDVLILSSPLSLRTRSPEAKSRRQTWNREEAKAKAI